MNTKRKFLATTLKGMAMMATSPVMVPHLQAAGQENFMATNKPLAASAIPLKHYRPEMKIGLGGVALGNGFEVTPDAQAQETMEAAWAAGVRYFDTSPWYGLGLSERRMGHFLHNQKREDFVISTKIGRLMKPDASFTHDMWKGRLNFNYTYDYSAAGVRRSIEDSLQRMGLASLDIVFIHDLSPDNGDMGDKWTDYFETARKGAMPELTKMREEGLIKGWGLGVNTLEPIIKTLEVADPDIFLSATQYSIMHHKDALTRVFPLCEQKNVAIVAGAPLNAGFLAGVDRYNYGGSIPEGFLKKRDRMHAIAAAHNTDLRTAALHFCAAPSVVASVIPGARSPRQIIENAASMKSSVPQDFWAELKQEKFIAEQAPTPNA